MYIHQHSLHEDDGRPVPFVASPHQETGLEPRYLIIHYTASLTIDSCVTWFLSARARASAHVIVGRDGRTVQMVPFDRRAWHAGDSRWKDVRNLNAHALGIELVNAGALERTPEGHWVDWAGHRLPDREVRIARHKHESIDRGWHEFPSVQVDRALAIARALHARYGFDDVLGHDDIAPGRKLDPGPAFSMTSFATEVLGRHATSGCAARPKGEGL
jgi:N-acetylmuramoyl-L-alanine amidase